MVVGGIAELDENDVPDHRGLGGRGLLATRQARGRGSRAAGGEDQEGGGDEGKCCFHGWMVCDIVSGVGWGSVMV